MGGERNQFEDAYFSQNKTRYYLHSKTEMCPLGALRQDLHYTDERLISRFNPFQASVLVCSH